MYETAREESDPRVNRIILQTGIDRAERPPVMEALSANVAETAGWNACHVDPLSSLYSTPMVMLTAPVTVAVTANDCSE